MNSLLATTIISTMIATTPVATNETIMENVFNNTESSVTEDQGGNETTNPDDGVNVEIPNIDDNLIINQWGLKYDNGYDIPSYLKQDVTFGDKFRIIADRNIGINDKVFKIKENPTLSTKYSVTFIMYYKGNNNINVTLKKGKDGIPMPTSDEYILWDYGNGWYLTSMNGNGYYNIYNKEKNIEIDLTFARPHELKKDLCDAIAKYITIIEL